MEVDARINPSVGRADGVRELDRIIVGMMVAESILGTPEQVLAVEGRNGALASWLYGHGLRKKIILSGPCKSKLDRFRPEIETLLAIGSTQKFIAKRYNTTPGNFSNWMKKNGVKKPST